MKTPERNREQRTPLNREQPTAGTPDAPAPGTPDAPSGSTPDAPPRRPQPDGRRFRALRAVITPGRNGSGAGLRRERGAIMSADELGPDADIRFFIQTGVIEPVVSPSGD